MLTLFPSWLVRYGIAVLVVAAIGGVKLMIAPEDGSEAPFLLLLGTVLISAWYGGLGPGLVATGLAVALANFAFMPPRLGFDFPTQEQWPQLGLFVIEGVVFSVLTDRTRRLRDRAVRQREWLRAVLSGTGDAVIAADAEGRVVLANSVAQSLTERSWPEIHGKPLDEVFRTRGEPGRVAGAQSSTPRGFAEPQSRPPNSRRTDPCILVSQSGAEIDIDHRVEPIRLTDGALIGTIVTFRDITARRQAEAELEQVKTRYWLAVRATNDAVWDWDLRTGRVVWNEAVGPLFGLDPAAVESHTDRADRIHPEDRERVLAGLDGAAAGEGDKWTAEYRFRRADDSYAVVLDRGFTICDLDGQPVRMIGAMFDLSERYRADAELRESEERFRTMCNITPSMIWMSGLDKACTYFNQPWLDFTGRTLEQEIGDGWAAGVHPDDAAQCVETYSTAFDRRQPFEIEYRLRRADGEYRTVLDRGTPRVAPGGEFLGYIGTCIDISDRKRAEDALRDADRRKDDFLAMLAHELRNPLAPILNALQIMRLSQPDDPALDEARAVIDRQVRVLARIVDDLLDVFRITHGKMALRKEPLDLGAVVRQTAEDHRGPLESARLELALEIPNEPVWIAGDRTRLAQVLNNLLQNAAKFSNPGGQVTVRVRADHASPANAKGAKGRWAGVELRDTGIGMTADVLSHIFETYAQAESSLDRRRGGLGLGLALVKGLVELHGGAVWASSAGPGQGSAFNVALPLGKPPKVAEPEASGIPAAGRSLRVLIVEDNEDTARSLQVLLRRFGHDVMLAHTGPEGVKSARHWQPNVVLCDLGLPEMDGYEVAATLRRDPALAAVRLIGVSGYGQDDDRRRSQEAGFDIHLTKPVDPLDLQRLLNVIKVGS